VYNVLFTPSDSIEAEPPPPGYYDDLNIPNIDNIGFIPSNEIEGLMQARPQDVEPIRSVDDFGFIPSQGISAADVPVEPSQSGGYDYNLPEHSPYPVPSIPAPTDPEWPSPFDFYNDENYGLGNKQGRMPEPGSPLANIAAAPGRIGNAITSVPSNIADYLYNAPRSGNDVMMEPPQEAPIPSLGAQDPSIVPGQSMEDVPSGPFSPFSNSASIPEGALTVPWAQDRDQVGGWMQRR